MRERTPVKYPTGFVILVGRAAGFSRELGPGTTMSPGLVMMFESSFAAFARRRVCAPSAHPRCQGSSQHARAGDHSEHGEDSLSLLVVSRPTPPGRHNAPQTRTFQRLSSSAGAPWDEQQNAIAVPWTDTSRQQIYRHGGVLTF